MVVNSNLSYVRHGIDRKNMINIRIEDPVARNLLIESNYCILQSLSPAWLRQAGRIDNLGFIGLLRVAEIYHSQRQDLSCRPRKKMIKLLSLCFVPLITVEAGYREFLRTKIRLWRKSLSTFIELLPECF